MAVVKNLMVRAGADFSALQKETKKAQKMMKDFKNNTKSTMRTVATTLAAIGVGKMIKDSVNVAKTYEASMMSIERNMGNNAKEFEEWTKTLSGSFGLARSEAIKYGSVYSNLVAMFSKSTKETMTNTQELLKASTITASATGRSMEDVMERIRSGMLGNTEAIEDLGIYVNVAMLKGSNSMKMFANGRSWEQLDFQTQQQIRMFSILEQVHDRYGNSVLDNTNFKQMQLVAQLKNVQLSLGQAFLPIYNIILPALTSFVSSIAYAMDILAQFMNALFGSPKKQKSSVNNINQQASAVEDLGASFGGAAKEANKAMASFDEINTLNSGSSGGGGGGGAPTVTQPELPNEEDYGSGISDSIQKAADKVKKVFADLSAWVKKHKDVIISSIAGIGAAFGSLYVLMNWKKIILAIDLALGALASTAGAISLPFIAIAAAIGLVVGNIVYLWRTSEDFRNSVLEIWNQISNFIVTVCNDCWSIAVELWNKYGNTLVENLRTAMQWIQDIIVSVWENNIKPFLSTALAMLQKLWDDHLKDLVKQIGDFILKLINAALELWNEFFAPLIKWLVDNLGPVFHDTWKDICDVVGFAFGLISDVIKGIVKILGGLLDFIVGVFTGDWEQAWQGVQDIFSGIWDSLGGIVKGALNVVIKVINWAIGKINDALTFSVPDWGWLPDDIQGQSFGITIPQIPYLAKGGIINSPTLAMVGEAGKEAVMPLENNTGWINELASKINNLNGGGSGATIILKVGETELGRAVVKSLNELGKQNGGVIPLNI